jgi:dihydrofolate reductase
MSRLIYSMSVSLDGYVATPDGSLDFVHVDDELHELFNQEARSVGTMLYGRRMYELLVA